jgi:hypothetical protein
MKAYRRGIPTRGPRDICFRSRLETKYAHLFDHLGWQWDYEPLDLKSYLPDFMLSFNSGRLLVEVKGNLAVDFREAAEKLFQSGYAASCCFFGCCGPVSTPKGVVMDSRFVIPNATPSWSREAWGFDKTREVYYDRRAKRLWKVYEECILCRCVDCEQVVLTAGFVD